MEDEEKSIDMSISSGGAPSSSRWNPTKEQISFLEGLYKQGVRTPSAEQIQQITIRLRAYGHIEGKNVFYWFQNHKARQRQKQKQENMVYINRFLHKTSPILAPPCTNAVCSSYCIPQPPIAIYPHYPKMLLPSGIRRRSQEDKMLQKMMDSSGEGYQSGHPVTDSMDLDGTMSHETLQLFPLHPTCILEAESGNPSPSTSTDTCNLSFSSETGVEDSCGEQTFFNFWSEQGS